MDSNGKALNAGKIVSVQGPVVDVKFQALADVPRPKAADAIITIGTLVAKETATAGAIGPSTSEFDPITAMQPVSR